MIFYDEHEEVLIGVYQTGTVGGMNFVIIEGYEKTFFSDLLGKILPLDNGRYKYIGEL